MNGMVTYSINYWSQPKDNKQNDTKINTLTGEAIIALLQLSTGEYGRIYTSIGTKTAVGLAKTIHRIINDYDFAKSIAKGNS
jgi:hypothetical protein